MLTQAELKKLLSYDHLTGNFTWNSTSKGRKLGFVAGCSKISTGGKRYVIIGIKRKYYKAHRLAFLYMNGEFPSDQVDHHNGCGIDNSWLNLRLATRQENSMNRKLNASNKSGFIGVYWSKTSNKWHATIGINGRKKHLGYFYYLDDAIAARQAANIEFGYHPNHGSIRPL